MDANQLYLQGTVSDAQRKICKLPIVLHAFASSDAQNEVEEKLRLAGFVLTPPPPPPPPPAVATTPPNVVNTANASSSSLPSTSQPPVGIFGEIPFLNFLPMLFDANAPAVPLFTDQDPTVQHLDAGLFSEELLSKGLEHEDAPLATEPFGLRTKLYNHQKRALGWMRRREEERLQSIFWEKTPDNSYLNVLTRDVAPAPPIDAKGGILADQMGLGKTIECISLILATAPKTSDDAALFLSLLGQSLTLPNPASKKRKGKGKRIFTRTPDGLIESNATLVVCPMSLLAVWDDEFVHHVEPGVLDIHIYYGPNRIVAPEQLADHDVVLTTYSVAQMDFASFRSPLFQVSWRRIILDEAHSIKTLSSKTTAACLALRGRYHWAVTGTPILNRLDELYPLIRFVGIHPFAEATSGWWITLITTPLKRGDKASIFRLRHLLLEYMMRRTKEKHVSLPEKRVLIDYLEFSESERRIYDTYYNRSRRQFQELLDAGEALLQYTYILELILRMRQCCDSVELVDQIMAERWESVLANGPRRQMDATARERIMRMIRSGDLEFECPICMNSSLDAEPVVTGPCGHIFCKACISAAVERHPICPLCRSPLAAKDIIPVIVEGDVAGGAEGGNPISITIAEDPAPKPRPPLPKSLEASTKIRALIAHLERLWKEDTTIKSVVFSQWTSMLNLVQDALVAAKFRFVRLDGTMSAISRRETISEFNMKGDDSPSVMIVSLKAGALGLNFTAACRAFLLDPWWNVDVETQACDRLHRLGQTREVEIIRLVMRNSVEERILDLQQRKQLLTHLALEKVSNEDLQRVRIDDLKLLFNMSS